jgi:hypothetical protein
VRRKRIHPLFFSLLLVFQNLVHPSPAQATFATGSILNLDAGTSSSYAGSGTSWNDISGNGFNATFSSAPSYFAHGGAALALNGTQFASIGSMNPNYANGFSATFYVNFGGVDYYERIIDFGNGASSSNIVIARDANSNNLNLTIFNGASSLGYCLANNIILSGWNHYGVVLDKTNCYFYRNGSLWDSVSRFDAAGSSTSAMTSVPATVARSSNYIGKSNWNGDANFSGGLGEITLYNRGLTPSEVYGNFLNESFLCQAPFATTTFSGSTRTVRITGSLGCQFVVPRGATSLSYLIVGGGGGGGGSTNSNSLGGGGGGAGGQVLSATNVALATRSVIGVVIGMGGAGGAAATAGTSGGSTSIGIDGASPIVASGGSGGGPGTGTNNSTDLSGDGGGNGVFIGGASNWDGGGGGAGAGGAGSDGIDIGGQGGTGGAGGIGVQSAISTDPNQFYGSGGGGGGTSPTNVVPASQTSGFGGLGGNGVGGNGGILSSTKGQATAAINDTGAGGGGAGWVYSGTAADRVGGSGANGIVFLRFTLAKAAISSIAVTSSSGPDQVYRSNETITVTLTFTQRVYISGTPRIPIQGLSSKFLAFTSGIDTTTINFTYTPESGDLDLSGFEVSANSLSLNGGTIRDGSGEDAVITHGAIAALISNSIDARLTSSAQISISASLIFRKPSTVTATITQFGRVTFLLDGKRIPRCIRVQTDNTPGAYAATCSLTPSLRGNRNLGIEFYIAGSSNLTTRTNQNVFILNRTGLR